MPAEDPVDFDSRILTEAEVYALAGYLAESWSDGVPEDIVPDVEAGIQGAMEAARRVKEERA